MNYSHIREFLVLLGAILGIVAPIGWDYYKSLNGVEVRVLSSTTLLEKQRPINGLTISYNGIPVDQLSKTVVEIANVGHTPILRKDVVSPLELHFKNADTIVNANLDSSHPSDIGATINFNNRTGSIRVDFSLLNPGDEIEISVLTRSDSVDFDIAGRIAGVSSVRIKKEPKSINGRPNISWTVIPVAIFTLPVAMMVLFFWPSMMLRDLRFKQIRAGTFNYPSYLNSAKDWKNWLSKKVPYELSTQMQPMLDAIDKLSDGDITRTIDSKITAELIRDNLPPTPREDISAFWGFLMHVAFFLLGTGYLVFKWYTVTH